MKKIKLVTVGSSVGVIIPKELLSRLRLKKGDELYLTEEGEELRISVYDPEFATQMDAAEEIMQDDRDVLRKLAK